MKESEIRKNKSIKMLKERDILWNENLPAIEDMISSLRRDVNEVVYRALALFFVAFKGEMETDESSDTSDREMLDRILLKINLLEHFTPNEKKYVLDLAPERITSLQFLWRYEACWVLLWALGYIDELKYPDNICDVPHLVSIISRGVEKILKNSKLRSQEEILDQADLIYRYHWAIIHSRISNESPLAGLNKVVVYARHYALNWLIGYRDLDWDEVKTHT